MLEGMGFTAQRAKAALLACGSNVERAVEWLFSHMDEDPEPTPAQTDVSPDHDFKGLLFLTISNFYQIYANVLLL